MSGLNKVILIGRVGKDPEVRNTTTGQKVVSFSLATSESWKDKSGQKQEKTEWHNVVIWNQGLCGVAERYVKKGSQLYIEGKLQTRKWQDQNGQDRYTTEIVLQNFNGEMILLDNRSSAETVQSEYEPETSGFVSDEIPFN